MKGDLQLQLVRNEIKSAEDAGVDQEQMKALKAKEFSIKLENKQKTVDRYPNDYNARFELGTLNFQADNYELAIEQFQVTQANPNLKIKSTLMLGKCFLAKKLYDIAIERLKSVNEKLPTMNDDKKEVLYTLAQAYEEQGQTQEAVSLYKQIYAKDIGYRDVSQKVDQLYKA